MHPQNNRRFQNLQCYHAQWIMGLPQLSTTGEGCQHVWGQWSRSEGKTGSLQHELSGFKARTTVENCMSSSPVIVTGEQSSARSDNHFRSELAVKFQVPNPPQSLSYIDGAWKSLSTNFRLPLSSAILDKTVEGSLHIKWLIPAFFVPQIMEMAEQPQIIELFREMKARLVTVDGACLYGEQEVIYFCVLYTCIHVSCVHVLGFAVCLSCHMALIMVLWSRANKHVTIAWLLHRNKRTPLTAYLMRTRNLPQKQRA